MNMTNMTENSILTPKILIDEVARLLGRDANWRESHPFKPFVRNPEAFGGSMGDIRLYRGYEIRVDETLLWVTVGQRSVATTSADKELHYSLKEFSERFLQPAVALLLSSVKEFEL